MKDEGAAEFDRRVRLGLIPSRNPYIGRVIVYSNQQHELLKLHNAKKPNIVSGYENQSARRHLQDSLLSSDKLIRLKLKEKKRLQLEQFFEQQEANREQAARRSNELMLQKLALREKKFGDLLSSAIGGSRSIDNIEKYLDEKDAAETEKGQRLCNAWNALVFRNIQEQITRNINDAKTVKRIRMRNDLYKQYLKTSDKGRPVFLDLISPEKYDPFSWTRFETKYSVKKIWDPIKRDLRKHDSEKDGVA